MSSSASGEAQGPAEPLADEERAVIEELGDEPHGVDHETMMSLIAALPE